MPNPNSLLRGLLAVTEPELEALGEVLPEYLPVDSSFIQSISFLPPNNIMVTFRDNGKTYSYAGDRDLFDEFAAAPSKGQFFNANIR